ncbi:hypothetical protein [Clostridium intestinale]|uniref:hypothetical protein n=1 Tax=Clostridium intestinale TaxID=36845 RepID=UPI000554F446|nr:hypothetical protein [Clostridium intestinale]
MKYIFYGLLLSLINLISIILGFVFYYLFKTPNQIEIQLPIAVLLSCLFFTMSVFLLIKSNKEISMSVFSVIRIYLFSMFWTPVVFVPLHYMTQGYLTSIGNILYTWIFQATTNILVLAMTKLTLEMFSKNEKFI